MRLVNCFAERAPEEAKGPTVLRRSQGIVEWTTAGSAQRAGHLFNGVLYVVSGSTLYEVVEGGGALALGEVGLGDCQIFDNGVQLCVVTPPDVFLYSPATRTLLQVQDPDFTARGASSGAFSDGYFLFSEPKSGRFFSSGLYDGPAFDGLYFATAEGYPDHLLSLLVDHRQVILFGTESVEFWENVGGDGFPFARSGSGYIELGCGAARSPAKLDNSVFWLASDRTVRRLTGYTPQRISQHGVEQEIARYSVVSDARGLAYSFEGHLFYSLTFPTEGKTWTYDATTQEWHERTSHTVGPWRAAWVVRAFGKLLVGDSASGRIGEMRSDVYTEFGEMLTASWAYAQIANEGRVGFHSRLALVTEFGVGVADGQGSDPQVVLEVSDDGGQHFWQLPPRSLGPIGERRKETTWVALGATANRVYRMFISDPVDIAVTGTFTEVLWSPK